MTRANDTEVAGDDRVAAPMGRKPSMAQQQSNGGKGTSDKQHAPAASAAAPPSAAADHASAKPKPNGHKEWFGRFAHETARLSGKPAAFILAAGAVVIVVV